ncbi:PREDICTED: phosphoinositide 3-kinase adapter protein 1 [Chrysochloris asiatica]|uniref:Phosphoinositide 3-kinase adapter protein 1 n=1 Tax=Chrysochloris asiatica TaxID=185453 RepID=A0A9B0SWH0_CHRAS|nr:PREDICTED: phosphoinositide 3-kinase adapter protein 1 [Chrysochloris asiatica]
MAASGVLGGYDILIIYSSDAEDWCQYLQDLFLSSRQVRTQKILTHKLDPKASFSAKDLNLFLSTRCIMVLLSAELVHHFYQPAALPLLQRAFYPPHRMVRLLCGVQDSEEFLDFFPDWAHWQELTCDDEPEIYVAAVKKAVSEDSGCDSVTDTEAEDEKILPYSKQHNLPQENFPGNLMVVQPERIRCGEETTVYVILRCKLDERVTTEAEFSPEDSPAVRVEAMLENEYTVSVKAPNLSSGNVSLKVYSRDLVVCETTISYYTDMEEIGTLLSSAANPVEFMCQAFKIVPYNTETLDKLLTESLKNNIPASGLHLFGISQLEEEDMMTNQRDEELPTLLHFAAKYGLKNLTALLLTCPGALQAYSVANKHGHYPNTIAEKHGFRDLRQFIDEYVETVDMLKSHIKEELMQGEEADAVYESMAHLSTDLLMKCSLNPGCDEDLYESMATFSPAASEDLYVEMLQASTSNQMSGESFSRPTKDSMIRKFLEGNNMVMASLERERYHLGQGQDVYRTVVDDDTFSVDVDVASRPPIPVPRPEASPPGAHQLPDNEPYISKVFAEKSQERPGNVYVSSESIKKEAPVRPWRDRPQSSIYDPFAGMKTPGQRQLITLQEQVKLGIVNVDEAVLHFKEWQLNQKKRSESFRFQQENLKRLRESITRRQKEKQKTGKQADLEITVPIRHSQHLSGNVQYGVYESGPRKSIIPLRTELRRGDWKTDSTSSTASSASNRSSTRSLLSVSSGMEGDNEDNEVPEVIRSRSPGPQQIDGMPTVPLERPPRVPPRAASQRPPTRETYFHPPPPVPPRGR